MLNVARTRTYRWGRKLRLATLTLFLVILTLIFKLDLGNFDPWPPWPIDSQNDLWSWWPLPLNSHYGSDLNSGELDLWFWPLTSFADNRQMGLILRFDIDLWPMTSTLDLTLGRVKANPHAKNQDRRSNCIKTQSWPFILPPLLTQAVKKPSFPWNDTYIWF